MTQTKSLLKSVETALYDLIHASSVSVPKDVIQQLETFRRAEKNSPVIEAQLQLMLDNIEYGQSHGIPLCQDTGHINLFIQIGENLPHIMDFSGITKKVLARLTKEAILRPNTVDPLTQSNAGDNSGENTPPIYSEIIPNASDLVITVLNKGGGSENMSQLLMLSPATGLQDIIPKIAEIMQKAGGKPCPPTILGIGIGGDAAKTMYYAKKSLLRPLHSRHPREDVAKLENKILQKVNALDIGVMGLGGHSNCLDVHIEIAMRHPATFPVGLVVECYCHRTKTCRISETGDVTFGKLDDRFRFVEEEAKEK